MDEKKGPKETMDEKKGPRPPVSIAVMGRRGYVWDADDAHWLRKDCALVGAMVGGVAAFKQQNAVHGLPLELADDEVTLAVEKGWGVLRPLLGMFELAQAGDGGGDKGRKRPWRMVEDESEEEEEEEEGAGEESAAAEHGVEAEVPAWQDALAHGSQFEFPTSPYTRDGGASSTEAAPGGTVDWTFPATRAERDRYLVFKDLHSRGFRITGGAKFGCDFLLYPGDPTLYHAQFCVRLAPPDKPILPALLAAACRGSFQARKHLLLASVVELSRQELEKKASGGGSHANGGSCGEERYRLMYTTLGPVEGFG